MNKHKSNSEALDNGTDHHHSKSCCDQRSPARQTIMMRTKSQFSRNVYIIRDRIWCNKHLRHTTTEKYDNNGKGWYIRVDDDNNISYKYIFQSPELKWVSWTHTTPYILITKVIERTSSMLDTPPQDKLYRRREAFTSFQRLWALLHNDNNGRQ